MDFSEDIVQREAQILTAIRDDHYEVAWSQITSEHDGMSAAFMVMEDALMIDGVRVNVSAQLEQQIADLLGASLLTAKLADLVFAQAGVVLPPMTRAFTASTEAMLEQSTKLDAAVAKAEGDGIVSTVGKHWIIDQALATTPGRACNYGWHFHGPLFMGLAWEACASGLKDSASGQVFRLIQGRGTRHDMHHVDYSQNCVLVARACTVDGREMDLRAVLQDPKLAPLASHQGVMTVFRQPGVTELAPL